jgi:CcmD family protein
MTHTGPRTCRPRLVRAALLSAVFVHIVLGAAPAQAATLLSTHGVVAPPPWLVALQQPTPERTDEFVPINELPPQEQLPAAPLLVAAYVFVWVVLLVYVVMLWRRLTRVEREIANVSRQIEGGRRSS